MLDQDLFVDWAAAAPGARVFRKPGATVVACADLAHWDRLVMAGDPDALAALIREVVPETGPSFRPFGPEDLVTAVADRMPDLEVSARFAWMDRDSPVGGTTAGAVWLTEAEWPEVTELLKESFSDSYAWPGASGVERWAGVRDQDGRLLAVAADAWSTPAIGFMAGVATRREARGRGLAAALCAFAADELLAGRDRVALLADYDNTAAVATYRKLGFVTRPVAAARQTFVAV
ncbi:ribosomal protein S18 acetylase RimI-like enzyme [Actinoplanes lutulentus]|uniref:FR47-like protein n=1 Tax=Actinoplanes lutulentus TaxID=1287878 RepID=A0A327YY93_9ACTN|nr:GNAT family N-acetyltransferase [Actinoplanes lutulentus]MBB2943047.1 ribosomal protein S18 acetylase RimI-like enzyme [Actinoplanes lutulentus]RAK26686.1 FR47-like protein [Actinoplanes lutulentus]